jgi:choline dehydrogenase
LLSRLLAVLQDGAELAYQLAAASPLAELLGSAITNYRDPAEIRRNHVHYYHPVGSCRMGVANDPAAVCGPDGQVHGLEGLYLADCSIIPETPRSNTNMPAVLIGERIAAALVR